MNTGEKILQLMENNGISAYRLSKDLNIAQSSISTWKNGQGTSYMKYISDIAKYFNVPTTYLLSEEDTVPSVQAQKSSLTEELDEDARMIGRDFMNLNQQNKELLKSIVKTMKKAGREAKDGKVDS